MKELKKAMQSLADDATQAPTADASGGGGGASGGAAMHGKAQQRAKKADDYHARHPDWVAQFNALTHDECVGGPGGVRWAAVRAWQQKHWQVNGLFSDGLIGPKTLEAAKLVAKKAAGGKEAGDKKDAPENKEGGEKHHDADAAQSQGGTDGTPAAAGNADAAEASVDKPKLEDSDDAEATDRAGMDDQRLPEPKDKQDKPDEKKADDKHANKPTTGQVNKLLDEIETLVAEFRVAQKAAEKKDKKANKKEMKTEDAGKDSAPKDLPGGLASAAGSYKAASDAIIAKWDELTGDSRAKQLLDAVNEELIKIKVPAIFGWKPMSLSGSMGQFHPKEWMIGLDEKTFKDEDDKLEVSKRRLAASTVFHEARHAEQRFAMARLLASEGKHKPTLASEIAKELRIHPDVAAQAVKLAADEPLPAGSKEAAKGFYNDAVVHEHQHRSIEHLAGPIMTKYEEARVAFEGLGDKSVVQSRWDSLKKDVKAIWESYDRLATEHDSRDAEANLDK